MAPTSESVGWPYYEKIYIAYHTPNFLYTGFMLNYIVMMSLCLSLNLVVVIFWEMLTLTRHPHLIFLEVEELVIGESKNIVAVCKNFHGLVFFRVVLFF